MQKKSQTFWSCLIGNILDHYDTALYGFLAPYIAPLFFPTFNPMVGLIFTYSLMAVSFVARPLGSLYFGRLCEKKSPTHALSLSLSGIAISTGCIGLIPDFFQVSFFAPFLLMLCRLSQGFFAAGENTVASLFILEPLSDSKRNKASSYYQSSSVLGILIASSVATYIVQGENPEFYWRIPFVFGFLTAIIALYLRLKASLSLEKRPKPRLTPLKPILKKSWPLMVPAIAVSAFTYVTYAVPFIFFNSFIPEVTSYSLKEMLFANTALLVLDMLLLPFFGYLSSLFNRAKFMATVAFLLCLTAFPLFNYLPHASFFEVTLIRVWIISLGLAFAAPLNAWFYDHFKGPEKYTLVGISYAIGSELFGRSTPAICLSLWHFTNISLAPAFYIFLISLWAGISLIKKASVKN